MRAAAAASGLSAGTVGVIRADVRGSGFEALIGGALAGGGFDFGAGAGALTAGGFDLGVTAGGGGLATAARGARGADGADVRGPGMVTSGCTRTWGTVLAAVTGGVALGGADVRGSGTEDREPRPAALDTAGGTLGVRGGAVTAGALHGIAGAGAADVGGGGRTAG